MLHICFLLLKLQMEITGGKATSFDMIREHLGHWGRVLFFETWEHRVFCLGSLYSAGLYSSPAILLFKKAMLYSACTRPSVSQSPTSKNHESHHSSTSSYRNSKHFHLPKMTSLSSPFTFENS